jgi:DNA-directed RNA polymerase beta subunit
LKHCRLYNPQHVPSRKTLGAIFEKLLRNNKLLKKNK